MRVEIIPANWRNSPECKRGDGTPTIDVCYDCIRSFQEGDLLPEEMRDLYPSETRTGSTDVAHPPYEDDVYNCFLCGSRLTNRDN